MQNTQKSKPKACILLNNKELINWSSYYSIACKFVNR